MPHTRLVEVFDFSNGSTFEMDHFAEIRHIGFDMRQLLRRARNEQIAESGSLETHISKSIIV